MNQTYPYALGATKHGTNLFNYLHPGHSNISTNLPQDSPRHMQKYLHQSMRLGYLSAAKHEQS